MRGELKDYFDQYGRLWHGPFAFSRDAVVQHAPRCAGVYQVLYRTDGEPLVAYIGIATAQNTIRRRLQSHVAARGNWALGELTEPDRFSFVYFECDDLSAKQIESHVLTTKKPPFNAKPEYKHFIESISVH